MLALAAILVWIILGLCGLSARALAGRADRRPQPQPALLWVADLERERERLAS